MHERISKLMHVSIISLIQVDNRDILVTMQCSYARIVNGHVGHGHEWENSSKKDNERENERKVARKDDAITYYSRKR